MKKILLVLACAAIGAFASLEGDLAFARGVAAYTNQNFAAAETEFLKAVQANPFSEEARYNLGNACYKQGRLGEAIANYRASLIFSPRDADCQSNLSRAESQTADNLTLPQIPQALRSFLFLYFYLGIFEQLALALGFWFLFWFLAIIALFIRRGAVKKLAALTLIAALAFSAAVGYKYYEARHQAVITVENAKVHAGPDGAYTEIFALHDGAEVKVETQDGSWKKINVRLKEGQTQAGWLEASQLKTIL